MSNWKSGVERPTENAWSRKGKTYRAKTLSALKELYAPSEVKQKEPGSSKLHWGEPKGISSGLKKRREGQHHGNPFEQEGSNGR